MDEQTRKLYEECNTGCQMAIESMQQIKDFTQDTTLFQLIEKYIDRHSRLGGNAKDHLIDGCSMGIKTLGERANTLNRADKSADALARKIIKTEEEMIRELESFL